MHAYAYQTDYFGFSPAGLHLLRNRFNYQTIPLAEIDGVVLTRGPLIRNWPLVLVFGLACLTFGLDDAYGVWQSMTDGQGGLIYLEAIAMPVFPTLLGAFASWQALRRAEVLEVRHGRQKHVFPLNELREEQALDSFVRYLYTTLGSQRVTVEPGFEARG